MLDAVCCHAFLRVARTLQWPPGSIVVMDRGYVDYRFLDSLEDRGGFVTRLKEKALFSVEAEVSAPKGKTSWPIK